MATIRRAAIAPLAFALLTGACSGTTEPQFYARFGVPGLSFATQADAYAPGDTVGVRLANGTSVEVGYNLCFAFLALERSESGSGWAPVGASLAPASNAACIAPLYFLPAGGETSGAAFLPVDLPGGTYRLSTLVEVNGRGRSVATEGFVVRAP